jgi:spermidine synthase
VAVAGGALAGAAAIFTDRRRERLVALGLGLLFVLGAPLARRLPFTPDRSKEYSILVEVLGAQPLFFEWTALFRTDLLRNGPPPSPPTRGLSRTAPPDLERPGWYLTHDATAGAGIYDLRADDEIGYVPYHVFQLPYLVAPPRPRVLVIGVGGGRDVVVAHQLGASSVTGVDLDPVPLRWLRSDLDAEVGGFFRRAEIRLVASEGRHFVRSTDERYDLIQLTGVDTLSAVNSGAYVLAENYLYTVAALHDYLDHLTPGGIFSLTMANAEPYPRYAGRMISVAREALRERGVEHPERHLAVIYSGSVLAAVLLRTTPFEPEQTRALARVARRLRMPLLWLPGHPSSPLYAALATSDGKPREVLLAGQDHRVDATRDDNPFFLNVFRWRGLLEPGRLSGSHASALSQLVLAGLLVSLTALGGLFILAPLAAFGRRGVGGSRTERLGVLGFFLALGLGFMLFEISLMQRFVLFLGHPTYSLSVTLATLLVSLGLGSLLSRRFVGRHRAALAGGVVGIALLALFYAQGLPLVQDPLLTAPLALRAAVTAALLAPLGLCMGIFLPLGVRVAATLHEDLVPWAWGINGCASVTAGVLAVVLAMSFGFAVVWLLSVGVYAAGVVGLLAAARRVRVAP